MKRMKRIMLGAACVLLLVVSWILAITADSDEEIQRKLIDQASEYINDEIYVLAEPILEEAAGYNEVYTLEAETALKRVYLELIDQNGYRKKYRELLEKQMGRENADSSIFIEAAEHYFEYSDEEEAFEVLRNGIEKTADEEILEMYENTRYEYLTGRIVYQDVSSPFEGTVQVKQDDCWGIADATGELIVPCEYDAVSTFWGDRTIVQKGGVISAVNADNNRVALLHIDADEVGNYAEDRLSLKTDTGWVLANGTFTTGSVLYDEIAMYSNGYAAAKFEGKWGLIDSSGTEWVLSPEYDDIIRDQLGRSFMQNAVFVRKGNAVTLLVNGEQVGDVYEDAKPFSDHWAAVKKNGKWGFIDTEGTVRVEYQFDDAFSFEQHLAAVKVGELWGFISLYGELVIKPVFLDVRGFCEGSAAVRTEDGWKFITLIEYR